MFDTSVLKMDENTQNKKISSKVTSVSVLGSPDGHFLAYSSWSDYSKLMIFVEFKFHVKIIQNFYLHVMNLYSVLRNLIPWNPQ